ncbi:MAG: EutN/CcmL family microcompartment protein [Anaeromicrobium sp.]|uniref:EutN/CcmL family microcompartment protein n=1 Tax=Anaeromicrobium sp. TaxID=1929132 RepID=UPI0025F4F49B|nr:EutN/CcmL family microcompartment protein [Anaeromicrobium sp.]MCT4593548.1 EutN/CcmL family microcompartment protein [Anaeromicrobium sp.]
MYTGVVIGTVVATRKDERLIGSKLLITQPLNIDKNPIGEPIITVDTVGAGIGEYVIFTKGTSARYAARKNDAPIDAAIIGIIDNVDIYLDILHKK